MANSVNNVLHSAGGDFARSTHYRVVLSIPQDVSKLGPSKSSQDVNVLAKTVSIPSVEHIPIDVKIQGHVVPIQGKTNFVQGFSITFYADEKHEIRDLFLKWLRIIDTSLPSNPSGNEASFSIGGVNLGSINPFSSLSGHLGTGDAENISNSTDLKIQVMDFLEQRVSAEYTFTDVYPIAVEGVTFDGSSQSQVQEFTVNFKYTTYEMIIGSGLLDTATNLIDKGKDLIQDSINGILGDSNIYVDAISDVTNVGNSGSVDTRDIFEKKGIV